MNGHQFINDEIRMSKSESMTNDKARRIALYAISRAVIRHSSFRRRRLLICRKWFVCSKNWSAMFTGLIEEVGSVIAVRATNDGNELKIAAPHLAKKMRRGDSVAVNGCCLTVNSRRGNRVRFDLLAETIARTNLKH